MSGPTERDRQRARGIYRLGRETADYNRDDTIEVIAGILAEQRAAIADRVRHTRDVVASQPWEDWSSAEVVAMLDRLLEPKT